MDSSMTEARAEPPPRRGRAARFLVRLLYPLLRSERPAPRPPTAFYTDTTVCIGCKACEVACKEWNRLPADGLHFSGNSYDNTGTLSAESWRHVKFIEQFPGAAAHPLTPPALGEGGVAELPQAGRETPEMAPIPPPPAPGRWLMMSDVCKHCVTAPCELACPTGAILHTEFTSVFIQPDVCNGCAYCVAACPFGVITRSSRDGHAHKCTFCYDRQRGGLVPACAKACPTASIQFGPPDELRARAQRRVRQLREQGIAAYLYGETPGETYSALQSFYLLVDRPAVYGLPDRPVNPWRHMAGDYLRSALCGVVALAAMLAVLCLVGR